MFLLFISEARFITLESMYQLFGVKFSSLIALLQNRMIMFYIFRSPRSQSCRVFILFAQVCLAKQETVAFNNSRSNPVNNISFNLQRVSLLMKITSLDHRMRL